MMTSFSKYAGALLSLPMLLWHAPVQSYDLKPIVIQLSPSGGGSSQAVIINNTHNGPIAIEVRAFSRVQNPDGSDTRKVEEEDIIISPPQMVIPSKSSQSFKVQWVGDSAPDRELAYRLITTQLPINFKNEKQGDISAKVDVAYSYEAALYIVPPKSVPSAKLVNAAPVKDAEGKTWLELRILSDGTRRAILDKPTLTLTPENGGAPVILSGEKAMPIANLNILVGNERVVRMPWPDNLAVGPVRGELKTGYTVFN